MPYTETIAQSQDITVPDVDPPVADHHVRVRVYDTVDEFNAAYDAHFDEPAGTGETVGACFSQAEPDELVDGFVGTLWFDRETVDRDMIIHESVHVGVYVAQLHYGSKRYRPLRLSTENRTREEVIAYVAAPLADHLIDVLLDQPAQELLHVA
ncbi:hypothetical protein [Rhodococcoides fascians]|uniref:hypothetical protein n=1 Tax=Rhodococcoides fascians TaxID=1828 RepID=UPI00050BE424|nr:hypothetical protein [Rhodococcus fascians]